MKLIIDIPDTDIPKRQDILSVDLCFVGGQVGQCTYPFEILKQEPIDVLEEIYAEINNLYEEYRNKSIGFHPDKDYENICNLSMGTIADTLEMVLEIIDEKIKELSE